MTVEEKESASTNRFDDAHKGRMSCKPELAYVVGRTIFASVVRVSRKGERLEVWRS